MNKEVLIDKIAFITDELQQQTMNWIRADYSISTLEVKVYLSNIKYLAEQASYLDEYLVEDASEKTKSEIAPKMEAISSKPNSMENLELNVDGIASLKISNEGGIQKPQQIDPELSLHEKLSEQIQITSLRDTLKQDFRQKDLSFSLNERLFIVSNLFDDDQNDFNKITTHLATLETWEEVEIYLNETCVKPYHWDEKELDKTHFYKILKQRFN